MLRSIVTAFVLLFTLLGLAGGQIARAAKGDRPNIIFLLGDDHRWDALGCYGNEIIHTPNIDSLARQGVRFANSFVTTSICSINRASIMTGQYASRHGIHDFNTRLTPKQLAESYIGRLKAAGYRTGFVGKWGINKPPTDKDGVLDYNRGFPGQGKFLNKVDGETKHLTTIIGDQALEFLKGAGEGKPFCLSVSFKAPHVQDGHPDQFLYDPKLKHLYQNVTIPDAPLSDPAFFAALPEFLKTSENRRRWNMRFSTPEKYQRMVKGYYRLISGIDVQVGRIVEELKKQGVADNTMIIYTGDNGFYLGERGFAGKWYPHEVSIRVPTIIYDPRLPASQRGTVRDETVLSIDKAPTMLAMAGVENSPGMQGESLLPLVRGSKVDHWRDEFFYEHPFEHKRIPRSQGVRTDRWKYIRYVDHPKYEELYDLQADPDEAHNLADKDAYKQVLATLRRKCDALAEQAR